MDKATEGKQGMEAVRVYTVRVASDNYAPCSLSPATFSGLSVFCVTLSPNPYWAFSVMPSTCPDLRPCFSRGSLRCSNFWLKCVTPFHATNNPIPCI